MADLPSRNRPPKGDGADQGAGHVAGRGTGEESYSWLYGGRERPDPEATQVGRPPAKNPPPPPQAATEDADQTRFLPSWEHRAPRTDAIRRDPPPPPVPAAASDRLPPLPPMQLPPPSGPPPAAHGSTAPTSRPPKRRRWWLRILIGLLVLWLAFLIAVPIWAWSKIDKVDAEPAGDRPPDQPGTTYLVVGSDSRAGLDQDERQELSTGAAEGGRTDTIMVLHTGDGAPLLMSIPRDSLVDIPGRGNTKINAAYAFGGPQLLVRTIEQNTGIRVDDYIEIGFGGFVNVVDAVGGVDICPEQAITDPKAGLDIEKGCQAVGGITALGYARSRQTFASSDIQRVQNQREVVGAIADKAASPWSVLNPVRYFNLADAGSSSLRVGENVGPLSLVRFAWALGSVTGGGGRTCTVPIADLAVNWDDERAPALFELIAQDRTDDVTNDLCTPSGLPR